MKPKWNKFSEEPDINSMKTEYMVHNNNKKKSLKTSESNRRVNLTILLFGFSS